MKPLFLRARSSPATGPEGHLPPTATFAIIAGMNRVHAMIGRTRKILKRAALFMAGAQLVLGSAPLFESGVTSASAHVETSGTKLHYSHNDSDCVACQAAQILASAQRSEKESLALRLAPEVTPFAASPGDQSAPAATAKARDPPGTVV